MKVICLGNYENECGVSGTLDSDKYECPYCGNHSFVGEADWD